MPVGVLHSVAVPVHMNVHVPPEQTWSAPQALPQAPQFSRSVWVDVQRAAPASAPASPPAPAHRRSPAAQLGMQAPFWQSSVPPQARPQAPQLASSLRGSVQRSLHALSGDGQTTASAAASTGASEEAAASRGVEPPTTLLPVQPAMANRAIASKKCGGLEWWRIGGVRSFPTPKVCRESALRTAPVDDKIRHRFKGNTPWCGVVERPHPRCRAALSMNGEGFDKRSRSGTDRQVRGSPLHSWRGRRGGAGEVRYSCSQVAVAEKVSFG
jgi:hypothetical protein